jgi:pimeloyl-ACP methyl ester carboxylesterase
MRLRKGPVIAALYPVVFLLVQLLIALLAAFGIYRLIGIWLPWWAGLAGFAIVPVLLGWFKRQDGRFFAYYLMHDYAYSASTRGSNPPELEARISEFVALISGAMSEPDVDEVLVVGHSSGAHLAVSVLADMIAEGMAPNGPKLAFLSLGQVVPMVSFLPEAKRLRRDLQSLSQSDALFWLDVTAPGDGCAFALCDPVSVSGVAPDEKRWPIVISAAFTQTLSHARWQELRWRFFRLHFQYLCAFDRPGDYDYFLITAGPKALADRFEGRRPSKSRIEAAINRYTEVAS